MTATSYQDAASSAIIVGLGNVGSKLAYRLAHAGFQRLLLVDHDRVTNRNLRCCADLFSAADVGWSKVETVKRRLAVTPSTVTIHSGPVGSLGLGVIRAFGPLALFGAVDSRIARLELARIAVRLGNVPYIDLAIDSRPTEVVASVRVTRGSPCLIESWGEQDWALLENVNSCLGANTSEGEHKPAAAAASGRLAADLGADAGLRLLAGDFGGVGYETRVDEQRNLRLSARLPTVEHCPLDHALQIKDPIKLPRLDSVHDLLDAARAVAGPGTVLQLEQDLVEDAVCWTCGRRERGLWSAHAPRFATPCPNCRGQLIPVTVHSRIDSDLIERLGRVRLQDIGMPSAEIIRAESSRNVVWLETADNGEQA